MTGADSSPLQVTGRTKLLPVTWKGVDCQLSFLVLGKLEGVTGILGMDALSLLKAQIDTAQRMIYPSTWDQPSKE